MQSLTDLNTRAAAPIAFTDNRGANVIFDRVATKDYSFTETQLTFNFLVGAEIVEIIQPASADVRLKINLGNVLATITYGDQLPSGVTFFRSGSVYTFYGITSVAKWTQLKSSLVINIDAAYSGNFSYEVAVVYDTDTAANLQFSYDVGIYIPTSLLEIQSSIEIAPSIIRGANVDLQSFHYIQRFLAIFAVVVDMNSEFGMSTDGDKITPFDPATYNANSTLLAQSAVTYDAILAPQPSASSINVTPTYRTVLENFSSSNYSFLSGQGNRIFQGLSTPSLNELYINTGSTFEVTLSATTGTFGAVGTNTSSSSYSFSGSYIDVNNGFSSVVYYPTTSSSTTLSLTITENSSPFITRTKTLGWAGAGSIDIQLYEYGIPPSITAAGLTSTLVFTHEQFLYGTADVYLVGGGGSSSSSSYNRGGASGGAVAFYQNIAISSLSQSESLTVGYSGGNVGSNTNGGTSSFASYSAVGGNAPNDSRNGANHPDGTYNGGAGSTNAAGNPSYTGGGAGAGGDGSAGFVANSSSTGGNGGIGVTLPSSYQGLTTLSSTLITRIASGGAGNGDNRGISGSGPPPTTTVYSSPGNGGNNRFQSYGRPGYVGIRVF